MEGRELRGVLRGTTVAVVLLVLVLSVEFAPAVAGRGNAVPNALPIPQSGSDWTNMSPTGGPSGYLINLAMVYDSAADRMITFGGYDGSDAGTDHTWSYSFDQNAWTNLNPAVHPDSGWLDRAAYDSQAERTVMFGGWDGVTRDFTDETWLFDFANNTWTNPQPTERPNARSRQGMAYDSGSDRVIIFGGLAYPSPGWYANDTWAYDVAGNVWTNLTPAVSPAGRRSPGMVYDSNADRMILFGGYDPFADPNLYYNDTWAYDYHTNTWTNMSPPSAPVGRFGFGFGYDSGVDRSILFGGIGDGSGTTWAYDFTSNTWSVLDVDHSPPWHAFQGMAYDARSARTIMFAGEGGGNDTWALVTRPGAPSAPYAVSIQPGNGHLDLRWHAPVDDGMSPVTGYRVYRSVLSGQESLFAEIGNVNSWTDTNVTNGQTYYYEVSSINAYGEGPPSPERAGVPDGTTPHTTPYVQGDLGNGSWYLSDVYVTLNATDDSSGINSTSYRVDGGGWLTYSGPVRLGLDGLHAVDFYSTDVAGNVEPRQTVGVSIDRTPPVVTLQLSGTPVDGSWYASNVTVEINATDATSGVAALAYRLDGGDLSPYTAPFSVGEGEHTVEAIATDNAGLESPPVSRSFGVDTEPPITISEITGLAGSNGWYVDLVTVALSATDNLGTTTISFRLDGGAWQTYADPFVVNAGAHTLDYYGVDSAGNTEVVRSQRIDVDVTPPSVDVSLLGARSMGWYTEPVFIRFTASDDLSGVAAILYRMDGGAWYTYTDPLVADAQGRHTLEFAAADAAGNTQPTQSVEFGLDSVAPESTGSVQGTAGAGGWYRSPATFSMVAVDGSSGVYAMRVSIDGGAWQAYRGPVSIDDGRHAIEYFTVDVAGNVEKEHALSVNVDTIAPTITGVPSAIGTTSSDVRIAWAGSDSGSGLSRFEISVDGGAFEPVGSEAFADLHLADGPHAIVIRAIDMAGNIASAAVVVTVDTEVFSLSGPYGATPLLLVVVAVIAGVAAGTFVLVRRRRRVP